MRKRGIAALAATVLALLLSACGGWDGAEGEVVFVNGTDTPVASVGVHFTGYVEVGRYANGRPIRWGGSIGFDHVEYPVTVTVYSDLDGQEPMASCVITQAPQGERWYVAAREGPEGLVLEATGEWPLD
ncbi:MAG: hypothetical protein ACI4OU_00960 [Candidatus Enterenecus sp.]